MINWASMLIPIGATLLIGVIGYFLKRSVFARADRCESEIERIKQDYTPKALHTKDIDELRRDVKNIAENYITKDDFFREQSKVDRKLDEIMKILLDIVRKGE